jgi:cell division protein FtsB
MRVLNIAVFILVLLLQYPLWLGKGGVLRLWDIEQQIVMRSGTNDRLKARNTAMDAEVSDLKKGLDALEERARSELGMIRRDEVFFQILDRNTNSNVKVPVVK